MLMLSLLSFSQVHSLVHPVFDNNNYGNSYIGPFREAFAVDESQLVLARRYYWPAQHTSFPYSINDKRPVVNNGLQATRHCNAAAVWFYHQSGMDECSASNDLRAVYFLFGPTDIEECTAEQDGPDACSFKHRCEITDFEAPNLQDQIYWRGCTVDKLRRALAGIHRTKCPSGQVAAPGVVRDGVLRNMYCRPDTTGEGVVRENPRPINVKVNMNLVVTIRPVSDDFFSLDDGY